MNIRRVFLILVIGVLTSTMTVSFQGCSPGKSETEQPGSKKQNPKVRVMTISPSKISEALALTGSVEPYRIARLGSPAEGPVIDVRVHEADRVSKGMSLLSIGRKSGVEAQIVSLREELKKEKDNLEATRQLVETNALPGEQLDQARAVYEKVRALLIKAEETARDYIITAPWDGTVSRVNVKEGEFVSSRAVLVEMYDPDSLIIRSSIPEKHAAEVIVGMHVDVSLDAYPGRTFTGHIERVYPYLDSQLRTRTVEVLLDTPVKLLPGMFSRLNVLLKSEEKALTIPVAALVNMQKHQVVFVVENGKAVARKVKTGIEAENRIQVVSGIEIGDTIIVAGHERLKDGVEVKVESDEKPDKGKNRNKTESPAGPTGKTGDNQ